MYILLILYQKKCIWDSLEIYYFNKVNRFRSSPETLIITALLNETLSKWFGFLLGIFSYYLLNTINILLVFSSSSMQILRTHALLNYFKIYYFCL